MKLIGVKEDQLKFQFTAQEKDLFLASLSFYPLLNPDFHHLSRNPDEKIQAEQELLRAAMEEERSSNKKALNEFVDNLGWSGHEKQFTLDVSVEQVDWLLRVLNDVRVGAWDIVGRPDEKTRKEFDLQSKNSHYYGVMELSGFFQSAFLQALEHARSQ